jgi:peroxiredoxin
MRNATVRWAVSIGAERYREEWNVIEEGTEAPDFELTTDRGERVKLSELRGKPVVLYFYPKDDTRGSNCSTTR